ncbi:PLP-dependent aminotransferase family protein [Castellaniella sp.]|uniref:MocR-like pyridoxine biosynthesis transcription factor PdxR n=1 Tax=Castellaniella sp. TaxID=1955812 RepID=UPI002AFEB396|nr:PLP-dependent aminotransferase family protein [Castellaniella sp.]
MESFILSEWLLQHFDSLGDSPAYRRLYQLICRAILEGRLTAGSRLPSSRDLAADLGIARNTVLQVYEQLSEEGYVRAGVGRGTYVQDISQDLLDAPAAPEDTLAQEAAHPDGVHHLSRRGRGLVSRLGFSNLQAGAFMPGIPDVREFPLKTWSRIQNRLWRSEPWDLMRYAPAGGYGPVRQAISDYLGSVRAVRSSAQQVVMTTGIHQGIDVAARLLCDPGDTVWIEEPAYWGVRNLLLTAGLRLVPVRVDAEGIWPGEAEYARPPRLIVVAPSHQYPLGMVMSLARRRMLLEYARQVSCWIIEDDYDSEFRYGTRPLASLQGMDESGRVLYAGSFSKTLCPGLRVGFMVVPEPLADAFANAVAELYREGNMMNHAVLAEFLREGHLAQHIRRVRRRYAERRACLIDEIHRHFDQTLEIIGGDAGLHLILALPDGVDDTLVVRDALQQGVVTRALSTYYLERTHARPGLLLGYAGVSPEDIRPAFDTLARVVGAYL